MGALTPTAGNMIDLNHSTATFQELDRH